MPEDSLSDSKLGNRSGNGWFGNGLRAISRALRIAVFRLTRPLVVAGSVTQARMFRREVIRQMSLTITNLHPQVIVGGRDSKGCYAEIYLNFKDFRLRITRAIYDRGRQDLWADIGSTSDPAALFRMDYVLAALMRLDRTCQFPKSSPFPNTLAALDATIWAARAKLEEHLSAVNYAETKRMVQQVMHEEAALAHAE